MLASLVVSRSSNASRKPKFGFLMEIFAHVIMAFRSRSQERRLRKVKILPDGRFAKASFKGGKE